MQKAITIVTGALNNRKYACVKWLAGAISDERSGLTIINCLILVDYHFLVDKSSDNIHKCYALSYTNLHFVQGLFPVQTL
jgi:hypothetical protein